MDVSGIGVQTITPTTGTQAQNPAPTPDRSSSQSTPDTSAATRVTPATSTDTGNIVDIQA